MINLGNSSKKQYIWEFMINGDPQKIELYDSKLKEKKKLVQDGKKEKIKIIVSKEIYGIVSSFILGFFADAITDLKNKEKFYEIFDLSDLDLEIQKQIDEEMDYILGE